MFPFCNPRIVMRSSRPSGATRELRDCRTPTRSVRSSRAHMRCRVFNSNSIRGAAYDSTLELLCIPLPVASHCHLTWPPDLHTTMSIWRIRAPGRSGSRASDRRMIVGRSAGDRPVIRETNGHDDRSKIRRQSTGRSRRWKFTRGRLPRGMTLDDTRRGILAYRNRQEHGER